MPRPRRPGAPEPKRRSRKGCWPCKARKVKCGEEKPLCLNCQRQGEACDYSVRLNWGGRSKKASVDSPSSQSSGYAGTIISFPDIAPTSAVNSNSMPRSANGNSVDGFVNFHSSDLGSPGAISPPSIGIFESPKLPAGPDCGHSPGQTDVQFASTWPEQSPLTPPVSSGALAHYPFGPGFHETFSAAADQGVGLRSLSAFAFPSNSVSQPVSFLRSSVDAAGDASDQNKSPHGSISQDEHSIGYSIGEMVHHHQHSPRMSNGMSISALMLNSHEPMARSNAPSSPGDRMTPFNHQVDTGANDCNDNDQAARESFAAQSRWQAYLTSVTDNYGLDSGRPDRDVALNNDHAAIDVHPSLEVISTRSLSEEASPRSYPTPSGLQTADFTGYYAAPVPINIPRYLSPLPSSLLGNPINLMYFHHFLNHTSRMLVPHDCDNNPFTSVLPSMAIGDPNLLNLLLAYSASHRARYLGHPEPANRIAHWVSDVFPTLRVALEASHEEITDSHLATAILLLSLKIVSPGTFEVPITWQSHLKLARELFIARSERLAQPGNRIGAFFARWLGYIDTVGALSCRQAGQPLMLYQSVLGACSNPENYDEFSVDCFTGFTPRTGLFLIRLAKLVQECDNQRFDELGNFHREWHPSADMVLQAQAVLGDLDLLTDRAHADPEHHQGLEAQDMMAAEEAFRCAGLIHLHRRVLGSSTDSFPVKEALRQLVDALGRMRLGASTEVCSLLPLFTAGCESRDPSQQARILNRFLVLEKSGLKQIQDARQLMQRCWEENLPWVALAGGEFFG
ncbi:hypothetical protein N7466_008468 [Penicillium verhagenii]|uniref:uncharacterized protein n=1 Tax=Penicillium verhagenii TaxID=1562060 RepID=UPI0025457827|nr:uncharacterized protein N7466_008468 [Penicillium verhagenii]KAJ5924281.1 hypothetical protein N7466_008468 [Penicillium verhagenii]